MDMVDRYKKAKDYLDSFQNYEKISCFPYQRSFKLERVRILLKSLKIPYQDLKAIHIAGTKGKGSTAHFLAAALAASGFKVGLFTSPHLLDIRERIQIVKTVKSKTQGGLISKKDLFDIVEEFRPNLKNLKISQKLGQVTFFEVLTAVAFKYFLQRNVDFCVLESGLGGRLDSTNVVSPLVSIVTHIDYDHTDKLGKKLAEITNEKAGIIKKNTPLVCSLQRPSSLRVIKNKCKFKNAPLFLFNRDFKAQNIRFSKEYTTFNFKFNDFALKDLKIYLKGRCQVENASLALATLSLLESKKIVKKKINYRGGFKSAYLPGRFEVVNKFPLTIVDVAHNVSSFLALGDSLKRYFSCKKIILIFACSQDKNAKKMLKQIDYSYLILTRFNNPRCQDPLKLKKLVQKESVHLAKDIGEALEKARDKYKDGWAIVISGSSFLVGEIKRDWIF